MSSNIKKSIETQKEINEAVEAIFEYFKVECSYAQNLETMADAQLQLFGLMEINRHIAECPSLNMDSIPTDDITTFIFQCNQQMKLLRPFAKLMGQVYGNEE